MKRIRMGLIGGMAAVLALAGAIWIGASQTADAMPPTTFRVTLTNMTDPPTPISPGALVGHCEDGAFWSSGGSASPELELIAEIGDPSAAVAVEQPESAMGMDFIQERYEMGVVLPGESVSIEVIFEFGCKLSSAHMLVFSNDTFVGAQSVGMWDPETYLPLDLVELDLTAYDAGTEANTEPGSGFDGGQPDPSRGAENLDNGEATDEPISASEQYTGVQAKLTIEYVDLVTPEEDTMEEDAMEDEVMEDDPGSLPKGGTGGLFGHSESSADVLTIVLAAIAVLATSAATIGIRRLRRDDR